MERADLSATVLRLEVTVMPSFALSLHHRADAIDPKLLSVIITPLGVDAERLARRVDAFRDPAVASVKAHGTPIPGDDILSYIVGHLTLGETPDVGMVMAIMQRLVVKLLTNDS